MSEQAESTREQQDERLQVFAEKCIKALDGLIDFKDINPEDKHYKMGVITAQGFVKMLLSRENQSEQPPAQPAALEGRWQARAHSKLEGLQLYTLSTAPHPSYSPDRVWLILGAGAAGRLQDYLNALEAERDRLLAERSLLLHDADEIHAIESANSNLQGELHALRRKVQYLIDWANKWGHLPEHYFTFADGDTWWATGHHPWENIT